MWFWVLQGSLALLIGVVVALLVWYIEDNYSLGVVTSCLLGIFTGILNQDGIILGVVLSLWGYWGSLVFLRIRWGLKEKAEDQEEPENRQE